MTWTKKQKESIRFTPLKIYIYSYVSENFILNVLLKKTIFRLFKLPANWAVNPKVYGHLKNPDFLDKKA